MLIEFKTKNFASFKNEVVLSMVASSITENETNCFRQGETLTLLKSAAIYGANSSGKSNLIKALGFMRQFVIDSSKEGQAGDLISVDPFRLSQETEEEPSSFEVTFVQQGIPFRYGFSANRSHITEEWLFYTPAVKEIALFERYANKIKIHPKKFKEGQYLNNEDHETSRTRNNALFLSVVAQFDGEISKQVIEWFRMLAIISGSDDHVYRKFSGKKLLNEIHNKKVVNLLKSVGLNIESLTYEFILDIPPDNLKKLLKAETKFVTDKLFVGKKKYDSYGQEGGLVSWDVARESKGTQKIINLSGPLFDVLENSRILIVDEFDARLHPLMTKALISLFHSPETNPGKAQFIFATHDTNLLSSELFRRDQIWFTEKDQSDSTDLYSLAEYKLEGNQSVRKDASYEKNYIAGKYGAIPYINIENLKRLLAQ